MSSIWLVFALAAAVGALLVGLIGFGSSLVILPVLLLTFPTLFPAEMALRLAAGTTMASMAAGALFAGVSQARGRHVCWPLLRLASLPYLLGALLGPQLAGLLPAGALRAYMAGLLILLGILVARGRASGAGNLRRWEASRTEIRFVLFAIGLFCSIAGIASGLFAIPYLSRFAVPLRTLIGTSTVAAALYSTAGSLGYIAAGWGAQELPAWSLGFVYLPAFAVMSVAGAACAPLGVRLAGRLSEGLLRRVLALFVVGAALVIAWG